jgi:transcriptional regulator with XRE-family HTH domain
MPTRNRTRRAPERGQRVALARKRAGLSQHQLAALAGVSRSAIARIELGVHRPTVDAALAIAAALDASVEALFGGGR